MNIHGHEFDPQAEIRKIVAWIRAWFERNANENTKAIIGISGGKDSTVTAALLAKALGTERVIGVMMPDGDQADIKDSCTAVEVTGIPAILINICDATAGIISALADAKLDTGHAWKGVTLLPEGVSRKDGKEKLKKTMDRMMTNMPPRIRMTVLYAVAGSLPEGGRVVNTCNRSESYVGWDTKFGDSAGDLGILANYTVSEVIQIGLALGLPEALVKKTPADGLCGKTDEESFGFSYDQLDAYILHGTSGDKAVDDKIQKMHKANEHKYQSMECVPGAMAK